MCFAVDLCTIRMKIFAYRKLFFSPSLTFAFHQKRPTKRHIWKIGWICDSFGYWRRGASIFLCSCPFCRSRYIAPALFGAAMIQALFQLYFFFFVCFIYIFSVIGTILSARLHTKRFGLSIFIIIFIYFYSSVCTFCAQSWPHNRFESQPNRKDPTNINICVKLVFIMPSKLLSHQINWILFRCRASSFIPMMKKRRKKLL